MNNYHINNCCLCNINAANKSGSHIIPSFILRRLTAIGKNQQRDKEVGFMINDFDTSSYIGRKVLPEELENLFEDTSFENAKDQFIPFIVDNYFCSSCETRFATIEEFYSKTLTKSKLESTYLSTNHSLIALLFWISIFWRCSVYRNTPFKLKEREEKRLRRLLDRYLKPNLKSIDFNQISDDQDLKNITYRILRCPDYPVTGGTLYELNIHHKKPYSLILWEYVVFLYFKRTHHGSNNQLFYGFEDEILDAPINPCVNGEFIKKIKPEKFASSISKHNIQKARVRVVKTNELLDGIYRNLKLGNNMPQDLKSEIFTRIYNSDNPIGSKDKQELLFETIKDVIISHKPC